MSTLIVILVSGTKSVVTRTRFKKAVHSPHRRRYRGLEQLSERQDGRLREARGRAWVVGPGKARLKVSFFWPFRGNYWIIDVEEEYEYAVIGTPNRKYLWILSRTPSMHAEVLARILQIVEKQGFVSETLLFP